MTTFYEAVEANSEEEFEEKRKLLTSKSKVVSDFLDLHWWKYKSRIVRYLTSKYTHFGVRDTSTVEGTHANTKAKLKSSQGDLYTVFKKLCSWWTIAASETSLLMAQHATIAPQLLQKSRYNRVVRIITRNALRDTDSLWLDAEQIVNGRIEGSPCSGEFRVVHGRLALVSTSSLQSLNLMEVSTLRRIISTSTGGFTEIIGLPLQEFKTLLHCNNVGPRNARAERG
eukprot:jgi/Phyca11/133717/e_gw1.667.1.1